MCRSLAPLTSNFRLMDTHDPVNVTLFSTVFRFQLKTWFILSKSFVCPPTQLQWKLAVLTSITLLSYLITWLNAPAMVRSKGMRLLLIGTWITRPSLTRKSGLESHVIGWRLWERLENRGDNLYKTVNNRFPCVDLGRVWGFFGGKSRGLDCVYPESL